MRKHPYNAPEISIVSVELESGIAQSGGAAPAGYGEAGAAGSGGEETGSTTW